MKRSKTQEKEPSSLLKKFIAIILFIAVLIGILFIALIALRPHTYNGTLIQSPKPAPEFRLTNHYGQETSLSDYRGKVVLLYFGYASCPDVCPATLAEVRQTVEVLGEEGRADEMDFLMVTVDPERDTAERMAIFLDHFHPSFIGLIGTEDEIAQIASEYNILYDKEESASAMGYLVNHTASMILIDPDGYKYIVFPYGTDGAAIAEDILYILNH